MATWNVQTLLQAGKLTNVISEMNRANIEILGIAEARWKGSGYFTTESGELVIYSGGNTLQAGVAVIFARNAATCLKAYRVVSNRILYVQIQTAPFDISFLQVYAPTAAASEQELDEFYLQVQQEIDSVPGQDVVIVAGDFNAKEGKDIPNREVGGKWGLGGMNEAVERLLDFCTENGLVITNTLFQHHDRRKHTLMSPDGKTKNQIDYILVSNRFRKCVTNSRAYPGADCA